MRKTGLTLMCAASLFIQGSYAMTPMEPMKPQAAAVEFQFPYNDPQTFTNVFFWPVTASCTVTSKNTKNTLFVRMLRKSAMINKEPITEGQDKIFSINDGDSFIISADSGAKVELTNQSEATIIALCTTVD